MRHSFLLTAWLSWLLAHGSRMLISPVLPLIEDEFGISHGQAGLIFLFLTLGYCGSLLTAPFWSRFFGYRRALRVALLALTVSLFLMRWAPGLSAVIAFAFCIGLTTGAFLPSFVPLLTQTYGAAQWGRSLTLFESAAASGQFSAPIIAVVVLSAFSWRYVYLVMAVVSAVVFLMYLRTSPTEEPPTERSLGSIAAVIRNPSLMTLGGLWVLGSGAAAGLGFFLPVYLVKERGLDLTAANQVFAAGRALGVMAVLFSGYLANRFTCRSLLGWVLALSGLGQIGIVLWPSKFGMGAWVVVEGGVSLTFFAVGYILIARLTAAGVRGAATGLVIGIGSGLGFGVIPWVLGLVADAWSFQVGIAVLGVVTLVSSLAVLKIERV
jgi:NNP family nitrate/nitrite transporter-like MFS transporter